LEGYRKVYNSKDHLSESVSRPMLHCR
jgi:hypothetical protein